VAHDSLFGERIIWMARPQVVATPPLLRGIALLCFVMSVISISFAVVRAVALGTSATSTLAFGAWCASLGLLLLQGPKIWLAQARYIVTENHVIFQRGLFRRTIERRAISFARIFWDKTHPGVGDIELVRAVPTGALRRRLMLRLQGVAAPDRVWAIIRGEEAIAPAGLGERPLSQRLDAGERVLWTARPLPSLHSYLPQGRREWSLVLLSLVLFGVLGRMTWAAVPTLQKVMRAGLPASSVGFVALATGLGLAALVVATLAAYFAWDAVVRRARLAGETRYLITDKRVLIQRGMEELHLGRDKIVDVIDTPAGPGRQNVFLVIDGPRARALAASGAFGEIDRSPHLRPVFEAIQDGESASRILRNVQSPLPRAA
jgi:hypothetical protein